MPDMFAYLHGFGKGSSRDLSKSVIVVTAPEGSSVEVANSGGYGKTLPVIVKNLLDIDAYKAKVGTNAMRGSVTWFDDGLWLQATGDDCYTRYGHDYFNIPAKPNTKYTISWDVTGSANKEGYVYAFAYGSDGSQLYTFKAINTTEKLTFTTPEGTAKLGFRFGVQTAGENAFYTNIQIEEGEKTDYARYNSCMFEDVPNGLTRVFLVSGNSEEVVWISRADIYHIRLVSRYTPEFTYTGNCEVVDDNDNPIEDFSTWKGNWKFRFLTSGTLTITKMNSFDGYVDMFLVGGAGGGGTANTYGGSGGGRTTTVKHVLLKVGVPYQITIGAGGEVYKNGGYTTIIGDTINQKAVGGYAPDINDGGWGGSGGAAGWTGDETPGKPGVDGSDGTDGSYWKGGEGQHTTTREFGEPTGKLYSTGGESSRSGNTAAGAPNTGDGSGANKRGGSGILVLRNSRAA